MTDTVLNAGKPMACWWEGSGGSHSLALTASLLHLTFVSALPSFGWLVEVSVTDPRRLGVEATLGILLRGEAAESWARSSYLVLFPHHKSSNPKT